jgi:hypothetical protein
MLAAEHRMLQLLTSLMLGLQPALLLAKILLEVVHRKPLL